MFILAISPKGQGFIYKRDTAHKVSKASKETICNALNGAGYMITNAEEWTIHEVDKYDAAFYTAENQSFRIRNGNISRVF